MLTNEMIYPWLSRSCQDARWFSSFPCRWPRLLRRTPFLRRHLCLLHLQIQVVQYEVYQPNILQIAAKEVIGPKQEEPTSPESDAFTPINFQFSIGLAERPLAADLDEVRFAEHGQLLLAKSVVL